MNENKISVEVKDLTVSYGSKPVIWGVNFKLEEGQKVAIVGPNGAGKSSLLKAIMGLIPSVSGTVSFYGKSIAEKRSILAYVPQREEIDWSFPINVYDVVMMARSATLPFYKKPSKLDIQAVNNAIDKVGLTNLINNQIGELSGGQQQRVFLARALAQEALIYLLDEPFASVDISTEKTLIDIFNTLKSEGKTIICVHHDLSTIKSYFDQLLLINVKLVASGKVEEVFNIETLQEVYGGRLGFLSDIATRVKAGN